MHTLSKQELEAIWASCRALHGSCERCEVVSTRYGSVKKPCFEDAETAIQEKTADAIA